MTNTLPMQVAARFAEAVPGLTINHAGSFLVEDDQLVEWSFDMPVPSTEDVQAELDRIDWATVRRQRAPMLDKSDQVFIRCGKAGVAWPAEWQAWTTALRQIPQNQPDPNNINWPVMPAMPVGI